MTQVLLAAAIALVPTVVWGALVITQDARHHRRLFVTFLAGMLSVMPLMLFLGELSDRINEQETAAAALGSGANAVDVVFYVVSLLVIFVLIAAFLRLIRLHIRHDLKRSLVIAVFALLAVGVTVDTDFSSVPIILAVPWLLGIVQPTPAVISVLEFLEIFVAFAAFAFVVLIIVALMHVVHLLHSRPLLRLLHVVSILVIASPVALAAIESLHPGLLESTNLRIMWLPHWLFCSIVILLVVLTVGPLVSWLHRSRREEHVLFHALVEEPANFIGFGLVLTVVVSVLGFWGVALAVTTVIFLACAEEYSKHLVVRFMDYDEISSIEDAVIFSAMVGLAFAFAENVVLYFPKMLTEGNSSGLVLRSVLTVPMHVGVSGIFGYFYGLARFAGIDRRQAHSRRHALVKFLHRALLFRRADIYREARMFEGLLIAGTLHATFNIAALSGNLIVMLLVVFVALGTLILLLK